MSTPLRLIVATLALLLVGAAPPIVLEMPANLRRQSGLPWIDYQTPDKFLLPKPPRSVRSPVYLGQDLACVPEVALEAPHAWKLEALGVQKHFDHLMAGALHLDWKYEDGYIKLLSRSRADLAGLPFVMGGACRTTGDAARAFRVAAKLIQRVHRGSLSASESRGLLLNAGDFREAGLRQIVGDAHHLTADALVSAHTQIQGPKSPGQRIELVRFLESIPSPLATRELARGAVYSFGGGVREAALKPLGARPWREAEAVLAAGIRYPWPPVIENSIDAIVKLRRTDMIPHLLALLEGPDPRAPRAEGRAYTTRELVRINHHRNCLLCHAPAKEGVTDSEAVLLAGIPLPPVKLPPRHPYEGDLLVRIDVTYLQQDFSVMQKVENAAPWPEMQRFDFVVRKRKLTEAEAADLRERLKPAPGKLSPYQEAAVKALRKLTGRDFGADAGAWRRFLKIPPA